MTAADQTITELLEHIASQLNPHDSTIAKTAVAELMTARGQPLVKSPQRIPQCDDLDDILNEPVSPMLAVLANVQRAIHWADTGGAAKPDALQRRLAFAELIGPGGMILNAHCRVGLFLQRAHTIYPAHKHAAEELFLVLSGNAHWKKESADATWHDPGTFIHHRSWESHAMTTKSEPLLTVWCWTGDISFDAYKLRDPSIDADNSSKHQGT